MSGTNTHTTADAQPGEETVFVADDVDEFIQRTRWKQILEAAADARAALRDGGAKTAQLRRAGRSRSQASLDAAGMVRSAVVSFVLECEPLYRRTDAGAELWRGARLTKAPARDLLDTEFDGTVTEIEPLGRADVTFRRENGELVVVVDGVEEFVELDRSIVRVTVEEDMDRRGPATSTEDYSAGLFTPAAISREAYRATNALLNHVGPGFEVEDGSTDVEGDYAALLDDLDSDDE